MGYYYGLEMRNELMCFHYEMDTNSYIDGVYAYWVVCMVTLEFYNHVIYMKCCYFVKLLRLSEFKMMFDYCFI